MQKLRKDVLQPFYQQLKDKLRQEIASGLLKSSAVVPDEQALAQRFGISPMTARRALVELAGEGLLKRVRGKGTFVRAAPPPQRRKRQLCIGILSPFKDFEPAGLYFLRLLNFMQQSAEQNGMYLVFRHACEPQERCLAELRNDLALNGLILLACGNKAMIQALANGPLPLVLVDSLQPDEPAQIDEVYQSSERGVFQAVSSLLQLGHRQIGLIYGLGENEITAQRRLGFERALSSFGIPVRPEFVQQVPFCPEGGLAATRRLLAGPARPTALFCTGDDLALGAIAAALEHGLKIPRDLSIIGFGDLGHFSSPPLSSVRIPVAQMGAAALRLLRERISAPTAPVKRILAEAEWIPRASCDCPRPDLLSIPAAQPAPRT